MLCGAASETSGDVAGVLRQLRAMSAVRFVAQLQRAAARWAAAEGETTPRYD